MSTNSDTPGHDDLVDDIRIADVRRLYILQHPLAFTLALGLTFTGLLLLVSPPLFEHTVIAEALPGGLEYPWNLTLIAGGCLSLHGFWNLDSRTEAGGLVLQATALTVWNFVYLALSHADDHLAVVPVSLAGLTALGCILRAAVVVLEPETRPWHRRS